MEEGFRDMCKFIEREEGENGSCSSADQQHVPAARGSEKYGAPEAPDIIKNLPCPNQDSQRPRSRTLSSTILDPPKQFIRIVSRENSTCADKQMKWGSIWLACVILFLAAVQFSMYFASLWPYMSEIDKSATQTFYGFTLAAYSAGQVVASPIFGYWNSRMKRARLVIATGMVCTIGGNVVYMFTEAADSNRKWIIVGARIICGIGAGIAGTVRGYLATASTVEHRARAIAIGTAALSLGITAGPVIQAALTPIGYPGYRVGPLHFNQYTAPAYISVCVGVVLLIFVFTVFKETYVGVDDRAKTDPYHYVPKYDLKAALLCIGCWFGMYFSMTNSETVESPYTMAVFNWNNDDAVFYNSIIMAVSSLISFVVYAFFAIYGRRINERISVIIGLCMLLGFYVITFPWPFFSGQLDFKHSSNVTFQNSTGPDHNASTVTPITHDRDTGCDEDMEWCHYTPRLPLPVYLVAYPLLSIGFPACTVALSTLFSKILGPRRQGFMQSLVIMSGSTARMLGPILISWLFANFGPRVAWTMTATVMTIAIFAFLMQFHKLVPLKMRPKLHSGQKLKYDGGTLYRF